MEKRRERLGGQRGFLPSFALLFPLLARLQGGPRPKDIEVANQKRHTTGHFLPEHLELVIRKLKYVVTCTVKCKFQCVHCPLEGLSFVWIAIVTNKGDPRDRESDEGPIVLEKCRSVHGLLDVLAVFRGKQVPALQKVLVLSSFSKSVANMMNRFDNRLRKSIDGAIYLLHLSIDRG